MFLNIFLVLLTLLGTLIYLLASESWWGVGAGLVFLSWLGYLLLNFPHKRPQTRGWWVLAACFFLFAIATSAALLLYWQNNGIKVTLTNDNLTMLPYLGARLLALLLGAVISLVLTLLFFAVVGYFSVVYILALPQEEGLGFWTAFRSYVALVLNIQYNWLLVENGAITEIKEKGFAKTWLSLGKVIIRPGNAVVFQKAGKITRICGAGAVATTRNEIIRGEPFDLRPLGYTGKVENVITADRIPLTLEVGIGYRIKLATNSAASGVIKESNFGVYPVEEAALRQATFNVFNWRGFAEGATINNLRDQFMAHTVDELFTIQSDSNQPRVNNRQIRIIELAVQNNINNIAANNGVEITSVDIRQITLPADMKEAIQMDIKSRAEAEAIARIEERRNVARGELVAQILQSIGNHRQIGELELRLATTFADISRRSLTDDILGHEYIEMLKALAEGKGTNIFNAMPASPPVDSSTVLPDHWRNSEQSRNGHS